MSERTFDRETLLDLTVNFIPLGIILFFVFVFLLVRPWEFDPFVMLVSMGLLVVPFVLLALLTFVSGRAISRAEKSDTATTALDSSFEESESTLSDTNDDATAAIEPLGTDDSGASTETNATESAENGDSADGDESADEH